MSKAQTREAEGAQAPQEPVEPVAAESPTVAEGGLWVELLTAHEDGEITFTRPGVEAKTFQVKDGRVRVTEEDRDWLVQYGVAREGAPE
jgi:hypothetical protein